MTIILLAKGKVYVRDISYLVKLAIIKKLAYFVVLKSTDQVNFCDREYCHSMIINTISPH